jgi:hypothetical protein
MHPRFFLLAFGFGNLAMLGWLAAAAAPLLIHLWSRHRFREAPWAAMQFLLAAMRKNARRLQLQQWLLLAVRTLIIGLVVLAAAEPYGEELLAGGASAPMHRILVIDGSYSMAYRDGETSRFARAKQLAVDEVRDSRPADCFTVILMAAPARTILGREVVDHATVAAQIEDLSQPHTVADLAGALTLVREALASEQKPGKAFGGQEVYFFTDLQRATWARANAGQATRHREDQFAALAPSAKLTVVDVGRPRSSNLAITNFTIQDAFVTLGGESTFDVALRQSGPQPRPAVVVELLVDDVPVVERTVSVPADGAANVRLNHRFQTPGQHTIAVRAGGDRLDVDNSRWMVVPVREEIRVLCVAGRERAAIYVADALNPNPAGESPIRPVIISESDLADVELSDFGCVFMCNVGQLTAGEAQRLTRYAASGGGVVFFLGDRVVMDNYNALSSGSHAERGNEEYDLIPARLAELAGDPQQGIDPLEYRHPIVAPFRGRERAGLLTTPVARYYRLEVDKRRAASQVVATIGGGDPFIIAAPLGRGRTVLVCTDGSLSSVDPASGEPWTQWPTWPSFLPVVRELLAYATGGEQQQWQQLVGTPLTSRVNSSSAARNIVSGKLNAGSLQIVRPDGRTEPVAILPLASGWDWGYNRTDVSGIYTLRGLQESEPLRLAVNVDAREGNVATADADELPSELEVRHTGSGSNKAAAGAGINRAAWNQSILWAAFALLFVESFMAWRFGRGVV